MTQAELIAELAARSEILTVSAPFASEVDENSNPVIIAGVQWKFCIVIEKSADDRRASRRKEYFYVKDEGTGTEEAFYMEKEPSVTLDQQTAFTNTALDWIYTQGYADYAEVMSADSNRNKIRVTLYKNLDGTNAETKSAIIWKDNGSPVQIRILT